MEKKIEAMVDEKLNKILNEALQRCAEYTDIIPLQELRRAQAQPSKAHGLGISSRNFRSPFLSPRPNDRKLGTCPAEPG